MIQTSSWPKVKPVTFFLESGPLSDSKVVTCTGYKEYNMHRRTLNWMGDRHKDNDVEVNLDGIGGVNILVKADVHRYGG